MSMKITKDGWQELKLNPNGKPENTINILHMK